MTLELVCINGAVIYLFGQGKGAQARGWTDEGGTLGGAPRFLRGARAPPF